MSSNTGRWAVQAAAFLLILGLIAFARGKEHQRGDEVGSAGGSGTGASAASLAVLGDVRRG